MPPRPPSQIVEGRERHGGKALRPGVKIHRGIGPRLLAGGQGRRKPPAFAGEPARFIRKSSMRSRPTNGRRRRRVVSPRASAGRGPSDSRIPETSRVGAAASPMFHRHKTGQPLTARPRRAARCRFRRFVTVRNSTRRARRTTEGARHAHLPTRKGCGPWRDAKFFSLALGLTAALAWPVRALAQASDPAPPKPENVLPPDQAFERLVEGNARYMSGVARRHDFPLSAKL